MRDSHDSDGAPVRQATDGMDHLRSVPETIWDVISSDPDTGVVIMRRDGLVLYMNEANRRLWTPYGEPLMQYEGRDAYALVPKEFADHTMFVIRMVTDKRCCVVDRTIWRGKQLKSTIAYLDPPPGELPRVIAISRHMPGRMDAMDSEDGVVRIECQVADFGPLDVFSPRELEVLALIGQGLRVVDIADVLHRSPKTIENHRLSIGRKLSLKPSNRVSLARLVFDAGLRLDDARLSRTSKGRRRDR